MACHHFCFDRTDEGDSSLNLSSSHSWKSLKKQLMTSVINSCLHPIISWSDKMIQICKWRHSPNSYYFHWNVLCLNYANCGWSRNIFLTTNSFKSQAANDEKDDEIQYLQVLYKRQQLLIESSVTISYSRSWEEKQNTCLWWSQTSLPIKEGCTSTNLEWFC